MKDIALDLLQKAERVFKGKELIIELTTDKDETVLGIRKNLARQAKTALQRPPLKAVVKPVPKPTPKAKPKPKPDPQPAPEPQSPPQKREVLQSRHDPAALINYDSMYHYRTDGTPRIIKSVFRNLEITTGNDVLELLGTTSPTEGEWDAFIRTIRRRAKAKNLNFGPSSEGTLYWWLTRKMGWIKPYHKR